MSSGKQYNLLPFKFIDGASISADYASAITNVYQKDNVGIQLDWTGTLDGTFEVDITAFYDARNPSNTVWTTLVLSPVPTASGSPDNAYIDITQTSAQCVRTRFVYTSGSGTLNGYIVAKGI